MAVLDITKAKVIALAIPLLLGQVVGGIQGTTDTLTWFKMLKKPWFTPPVVAFPIVWTALYALMGYASYIVWTYGGFEQQGSILLVYGIQLALNLAWPLLFFKLKKLKLAQVENLVLLVTAALTANSFYCVDRLAGKLMWPYLAWLVLANALNISIAAKNPDGDDHPARESLYDSESKRNPGEQGNFPAATGPTTASLQQHGRNKRDRKPLVVFARQPLLPRRRNQIQHRQLTMQSRPLTKLLV